MATTRKIALREMEASRAERQRQMFRPIDPVTQQSIELATRPRLPERPTLTESALWAALLQIPNRLFGATITPEGDAT